eukprot:1161443-Pelagomonas_calceolata.AAC.5
MPASSNKQHNSSNGSKASIRQRCSSPTSNQPISMQPKLSRVLARSPPFTPLFGVPSEKDIGYCTQDTNLYASHSQPDNQPCL